MKFDRKKAKRLVEQSGVSLSQIARDIGVTPATVSNALTGRSAMPSIETLMKLSKRLGVHMSELLLSEDDEEHAAA